MLSPPAGAPARRRVPHHQTARLPTMADYRKSANQLWVLLALPGAAEPTSRADAGGREQEREMTSFWDTVDPTTFVDLRPRRSVSPSCAGGMSRTTHGRSEERRVGKECVSTCRYRGSPKHEKK